MKYFKYINITLLSVIISTLKAQDRDDYALNLIYYNHGDSVSLIWNPSSYHYFRHGVENGYVVERRIISINGVAIPESERRWVWLEGPLFPASNEVFTRLSDRIEKAEIMQELIYRNVQSSGVIPEDANFFEPDGYSELQPLADGSSESEEELMFSFGMIAAVLNLPVAKACAFFYVDKKTDPAAVYEYRVFFGRGRYQKDCQIVTVDMSKLTVLPQPKDIKADFGKKTVFFQWNVADFLEIYAAYRLERSLDGKNFVQVNTDPIIYGYGDEQFENICMTKDAMVDPKVTHYYRVSGYSPFGIYGPPSEVVQGKGVPDFEVSVSIDEVIINNKNEATIKWSVSPPEAERLIRGFVIDRARSLQGEFEVVTPKMIPPKRREYKDKLTMRTNYYRVHALGRNEGEIATSFAHFAFQIDSVPPEPPVGLRGEIDSMGVATLQWDPNKEDDILGYRVFISNDGSEGSFISRSDTLFPNPIYIDTLSLATLTNEVYYKVVAVDLNYNHSKMSEAVKLMKPDTIPPAKAVFIRIDQPGDQVELHWENSPSVDVDRVVLLSRIGYTGEISVLKEWDKRSLVSFYRDVTVFQGEPVRYYLRTYDYSGNMSEEESLWFTTSGTPPGCASNLTVKANHDKGVIELSWERGQCNIEKFHIYRRENDGRMLLLTTLNGAQRFFEDTRVTVGSSYVYVLQTIAERPSKSLTVDAVAF
jgi:hypothetical protein